MPWRHELTAFEWADRLDEIEAALAGFEEFTPCNVVDLAAERARRTKTER